MKKLFIGLLIVAAGAGAFFFFNKKKDNNEVATINKELIIGKWKTDAVMANDSNLNKYSFDFQKSGTVLKALSDSSKADTTHYEWNKINELVWKKKSTDSTGNVYAITKLTTDSLQLFAKDSSTILFTKMK